MTDERDPARARADAEAARAEQKAERERRVDHVLDLMAKGEWASRMTFTLAQEWGCSWTTVRDYASEAGAILRHVYQGDPEVVRAKLVAGIEAIRERCFTRTRSFVMRNGPDSEVVETPDPDLKTALASYSEMAKVLGVVVTKHQEVPSDNATPEETLAQLEGAAAKLREAIAAKSDKTN